MVQDTNNSESSTEELEDDDSLDSDLDENSDDDTGDDEASKANKKSAQARIDELTGRLKAQEDEIKALKETKTTVPTPPAGDDPTSTPEAQKVIKQLETLGFTRKTDVEKEIRVIEDRMTLNAEHLKLGTEYDGSDGRPKYDKAKIEGYMRDKGVYDPEVAYKAMNEAELLDWHLKKADAGSKKKPYIEKPGGSGVNRTSDNQITKEKLQEVAQNPTPANRAWYERNRNKILQMHSEGQFNS